MESQNWEKLWEIFHQAREKNPADRANFLKNIDSALRSEVEELLDADRNEEEVLDNLVAQELEQLQDSKVVEIKADTMLTGRFRIIRQLGKGGMGTVYEAFDEELGTNVALKTMRSDLIQNQSARDRFHREINLARKITHPNACRIFDLFQHEQNLFLTMELLQGETLQQKIKREGPMDPQAATPILRQILETLTEMHRSGIVHRDLKTSNIILVPNGNGVRAVVTDFGLAIALPGSGSLQVTRTGEVLGTPEYMAPEQLKQDPITPATDIYTFGLVMFEMITGKLPLEGESPLTIAAKRISEDAPSPRIIVPNLDRKWEAIILRCLERHPKHRFASASEVLGAITGNSLIPLFLNRHRKRLSFAVVLFIAMLLVVYAWQEKNRARQNLPTIVGTKRIWTGATGLPAGAISTDGKVLIDIDWEKANVMAIDLATGKKRILTKSKVWFHPYDFIHHPAVTLLSPDGKQVVYNIGRNSRGGSELRTVGTDGSQPGPLYVSETTWITPFDWSPDAQQIAALFLRNDGSAEIGLVNTKDGNVRKVKKIDSAVIRKISFSPDGHYIAYDSVQDKNSSKHDLLIISLKDGSENRVVAHQANDYLLGWTPDGKQILFASDRSATNDAWNLRIVNGKPQGSPELIRKDIGQIFPLKITKDGSLYYAHLLSGTDVYTATLDPDRNKVSSPPSRLIQGDVGFSRAAAFSPDGNFLVFQSIANPLSTRWSLWPERLSLKVVSLNSDEVRELTPEINSSGTRTRWSPDGNSVLTRGYAEKGRGVYKIDVKTGESLQVIPELTDWIRQYHWSADGSSIYYLTNKGGTIVQREMKTGSEKKVYQGAADFDLSSDGQWLAVMAVDIYKGISTLRVAPASGGKVVEILKLPMPEWISALAWMPDGKSILFSRGRRDRIDDPHRILKISKNGGSPQDLGISSEYVQDFRIHPDGRRIAIWTVTDTSEVWVMDNFIKTAN